VCEVHAEDCPALRALGARWRSFESGTFLRVTAALLELIRARIDLDGVPVVDGLSLATTGDKLIVLGGPRALFEAASGVRAASHGEVRVRGVSARRAARGGNVAGAPGSPPFPPKWTARDYVRWSARVTGHGKRDASALAEQAMSLLKMPSLSEPLVNASVHVRRAVSIASALATGAEAIFLEEPLAGLPEEAGRHFARIVLRALEGRSWIVFAARLPLESPFAMDADEAAIVSSRGLLAQGAPAELAARERAYALRLLGKVERFARLATEKGARVSGSGSDLTVDLGDGLVVSDLLRVAKEAEVTVLELEPLAHAFA
jgi:ABC-2 type transport system ATP-binding protein